MSEQPTDELRTLVIGAGVTGLMTIDRMLSGESDMPGVPVAAVDDDEEKAGSDANGVKVVGSCDDIPRLVKELDIA